ncbi:DNA ligase 1-like isoform X3 [Argopecten irradians]|uniref:DNA ligase 1-like isoform X3 n=1 Tax=Argopecten irradians TaxID=31199 RepID=UPI003711AB80
MGGTLTKRKENRSNQVDVTGIIGNKDPKICFDSNSQIVDNDKLQNLSSTRKTQVEDFETSSNENDQVADERNSQKFRPSEKKLKQRLKKKENEVKRALEKAERKEHEFKRAQEQAEFHHQRSNQVDVDVTGISGNKDPKICFDSNSQIVDNDKLQNLSSEKKLKERLKKKEDELKRALEQAEFYRQRKEDELKCAQEKAEVYRQRFSKLASAKMTEGNPNIADLSDPNRPTNLATKYKELYDNEWTNAYETLTKNKFGYYGKEAIKLLREIVVECYEQCMKISKEQWEKMATVLSQRKTENADKTLKEIGFQETEFKDLKKFRRMATKISSNKIVEKVKGTLWEDEKLDVALLQELETYIEACTRLSWEMALQDPPLHMFWDLKQDDPPNSMFQTYTQSGTKVSYVVWPCLLRQEGGDLLAKGVYQLYK